MFAWLTKKPEPTRITASELIILESAFEDDIRSWNIMEENAEKVGNLVKELVTANIKVFFLNDPIGEKFRQVITEPGFTEDFSVERLRDLHILVSSKYPKAFIDGMKDRFFKAIDETNHSNEGTAYLVNKSYPYAWLLFFVQKDIKLKFFLETSKQKR